ncbi:hypothetical protein PILCRDRAFT_818969 [Piloderma croceum F 1598]|uniref:BOD1/SHG1 domain-containing protein n=1 Tax=Piloderma croceum (strain F 1598) TaxID=765440 RepID=A0A0C3FWP2_PILCF|nr:hypothetical protein PILCRDRAFT_818969 [Piloderma croceum F 1598]
MTISNPTQLVDAYKKSGEFDRLRRELLASFQNGEGMSSFMNRVEDIARKKLDSDQRLQYMPPETVHRELQQELDRSVYGSCYLWKPAIFLVKVPDC